MSAQLVWHGLEELKAELRNLPAHLAEEADAIVAEAADTAGSIIKAAYNQHRWTGNLANGVVVRKTSRKEFRAAYTVKSTAPHAHIFELGTEARHYVTHRGVMKSVGRMPAAHIFLPVIIRERRNMFIDLEGMLIRNGLRVTGEP